LGNNKRSVADVKTKWTDLRSRTKQKAAAALQSIKKTGGGEPEDLAFSVLEEKLVMLTSMERQIVKLGGKQWLFGIDGGIDTSQEAPEITRDNQEPQPTSSVGLIANANVEPDLDFDDVNNYKI
jgi:hypothetical protein